jgi:hypothetical protein
MLDMTPSGIILLGATEIPIGYQAKTKNRPLIIIMIIIIIIIIIIIFTFYGLSFTACFSS